MMPLLVLLFGVAPTTAVGTDLWFAAVTKIVGGVAHGRRQEVDWQVLRRLWAGSLPAALATVGWLAGAGGERVREGAIVIALGSVLLATGAAMLLKQRLHGWARGLRIHRPDRFKRLQPAGTVLAGAILGFLVALTSVGAGALGAVMLVYLYPLRMRPLRLVGTDIVHAVPLTLVAGLGHLWLGRVEFGLLAGLLCGSVPGVLLGTAAAGRLPEPALRAGIAVLLALTGLKMVAST
jgi:uncharacterized membrane protein YfcA